MSDTRDRIVETTAELFRRQGYVGTGLKQIVAGARAPFGSVYHFFPGGKAQLGAEVIRTSGAAYGQLIDHFYGNGADPVEATRAFFAAAAQTLIETDYADACPIATVALEVASTDDTLRQATADVFVGWRESAAGYLENAGADPGDAVRAATALTALLEGAFILSRATRTTDPVLIAGDVAVETVRRILPSFD